MTNPAWLNQNARGFGTFGDGDRGSSSAVPHSERNIHHLPGSRANMTSSMTAEELESPVTNQTSNSAHRDYHRESQQRGYCRSTLLERRLNVG